jgi:triosephosphate isomerase
MAMKTPIIFANWKMNKTLAETEEYFRRFLGHARKYAGKAEIFILVSHTALAMAADLVRDSEVKVGSQNHFWEDFGPYTGEISAAMVRDCGGKYALIGHYERRLYFHESLDHIRRKARAALRNRLIPVICIGESIGERQAGETGSVIKKQIDLVFEGFTASEIETCYLLYEPYWAVGAEKPAEPSEAQKAHSMIRDELRAGFGKEAARDVKVLYGGSVRRDHVLKFLVQPDIDGAGVGRAGLDPDSFLEIIEAAASAAV